MMRTLWPSTLNFKK